MKKIILFLFLGCCGILSGCAAGELTFEEKCTAVYKWFTALHKDNEYIFTLRNVKDKKALREIIFDFCSTNDFEFIIEKEEHISEDHEKRLDEAFLLTQPKIKVFIFHHKTLDAALFYIPKKIRLKLLKMLMSQMCGERKSFLLCLINFVTSYPEKKLTIGLNILSGTEG